MQFGGTCGTRTHISRLKRPALLTIELKSHGAAGRIRTHTCSGRNREPLSVRPRQRYATRRCRRHQDTVLFFTRTPARHNASPPCHNTNANPMKGRNSTNAMPLSGTPTNNRVTCQPESVLNRCSSMTQPPTCIIARFCYF